MEEILSPIEELNTTVTPDDAIESAAPEASAGEIDLSELASLLENEGNAESPAPAKAKAASRDGSAQPSAKAMSQEAFNAALSGRLTEERFRVQRRFEQSPEYQIGAQLLRTRMAQEGVTAEEAARKILDEHISARAESYKNDPKAFYEDMLRGNMGQPVPAQPTTEKPNAPAANSIAEQLVRAREAGIMPEHFTSKDITSEFVQDVSELGAERALRVWSREHAAAPSSRSDILGELSRRQAQPQPMRSTGDNVGRKPIDFTAMSDEEFERWEAEINRRAARGERIMLR